MTDDLLARRQSDKVRPLEQMTMRQQRQRRLQIIRPVRADAANADPDFVLAPVRSVGRDTKPSGRAEEHRLELDPPCHGQIVRRSELRDSLRR